MDVFLAAEASSSKVRHHRCAAASPRPQLQLDRCPQLVRWASRAHLHPGQGGHHYRPRHLGREQRRSRVPAAPLSPGLPQAARAAGALPAILDAARGGQLTTLDALEQLLSTEAAAVAERKLTSGCAAAASVATRATTRRRSP